MATNPTPSACMKCNTPLVPGTAFCGTCGTPAGTPGLPPMPPPMPPRPMSPGASQVILPMDQHQSMQAAMATVSRVGGEITNQSPVQAAFRMGNFFTGRVDGSLDTFPEGPNRTAVNVSMKPNYASLLPGALIALALALILFVILQKAAVDATAAQQLAQTQAMLNNPYGGIPPVQSSAGIGYFLQPWMIFLLVALGVGLAGYILGGPMLDKSKRKLLMALQSVGATPPGMPGSANQGFGPQAGPVGLGGPVGPGGPIGAGMPHRPAQPQPATPFEQLRKLAELRDSGAISMDDFEKAKADILKKVG